MPSGALNEAPEKEFGSVEAFKNAMSDNTAAIQGSGWGWLVIFFPPHP